MLKKKKHKKYNNKTINGMVSEYGGFWRWLIASKERKDRGDVTGSILSANYEEENDSKQKQKTRKKKKKLANEGPTLHTPKEGGANVIITSSLYKYTR